MSVRDFGYANFEALPARGDHAAPQRAYVTGVLIALGGIVLFFAALLSAWVVRKGLADVPELPLGLPVRLLAANTLVLMISGVAIEFGRRKVGGISPTRRRNWWYAAIGLGALFLAGQAMAWHLLASAGVFLASSPDASFFYLLTAAHGVHLIGGICGLVGVTFWPMRRVRLSTAADVAALYWHALTAIWICIFVFLLVFRS